VKFDNNVSLEQWAEKVMEYELSLALKCLKKGDNIETVMETMAYRIQQKILYPLLSEINKSPNLYVDIDKKL
jgi:hypothetical protein